MNMDPAFSRKDYILKRLADADSWCSGENLAGALGISRAAVAKHINTLREDGHVIEAAPKKGYRLVILADVISSANVAAHLATRIFGRSQWHLLPETTSTNNVLVGLALEGAPEGTMVVAEAQSKGRGRKSHEWFSSPRGLHFSVLLQPGLATGMAEILIQCGTVAVAQMLWREAGLSAQVKAPNDVMVKGRKIAGILLETGFRGMDLEWAVLGIGCNLNARQEDFPVELQAKTTSTFIENGRWVSRNILLASFLNIFESWYDKVRMGESGELLDAWEQLSM